MFVKQIKIKKLLFGIFARPQITFKCNSHCVGDFILLKEQKYAKFFCLADDTSLYHSLTVASMPPLIKLNYKYALMTNIQQVGLTFESNKVTDKHYRDWRQGCRHVALRYRTDLQWYKGFLLIWSIKSNYLKTTSP